MAQKPQESYGECVARVKREYPVPPGNINEQNQLIQNECGNLSTKENASDIKCSMIATGNFKEDELDFLTDDYLKDIERIAVPLKLTKPTAAQPHVFQGNHLVTGGTWSWKSGNTPADFACGQTQTYSRKAYPGDRYRSMGNCPQGGGPWYEITMWYQDELDR